MSCSWFYQIRAFLHLYPEFLYFYMFWIGWRMYFSAINECVRYEHILEQFYIPHLDIVLCDLCSLTYILTFLLLIVRTVQVHGLWIWWPFSSCGLMGYSKLSIGFTLSRCRRPSGYYPPTESWILRIWIFSLIDFLLFFCFVFFAYCIIAKYAYSDVGHVLFLLATNWKINLLQNSIDLNWPLMSTTKSESETWFISIVFYSE